MNPHCKIPRTPLKGCTRLQFKRSQSGQVYSAEVEALKAPRGVKCGEGASPQKTFLLSDLKTEHFGSVFKLDLTEETRTQLQEDEANASSCLILAMPHDHRMIHNKSYY